MKIGLKKFLVVTALATLISTGLFNNNVSANSVSSSSDSNITTAKECKKYVEHSRTVVSGLPEGSIYYQDVYGYSGYIPVIYFDGRKVTYGGYIYKYVPPDHSC